MRAWETLLLKRSPVTFGLVVLLLGLATIPAAFTPARKATRVEPIITLKAQ